MTMKFNDSESIKIYKEKFCWMYASIRFFLHLFSSQLLTIPFDGEHWAWLSFSNRTRHWLSSPLTLPMYIGFTVCLGTIITLDALFTVSFLSCCWFSTWMQLGKVRYRFEDPLGLTRRAHKRTYPLELLQPCSPRVHGSYPQETSNSIHSSLPSNARFFYPGAIFKLDYCWVVIHRIVFRYLILYGTI